jgi:hypothetical protein
MNYGDTALGVECALPRGLIAPRRRSRAGRLIHWLISALSRRA